jgi:beta-xylosidase
MKQTTRIFSHFGMLVMLSCSFLLHSKGRAETKQVLIHKNDKLGISAEVSYPYQFTFEGNPVSRIHGAADPDVQVWDGVLWVYTSQDRTVDPAIHERNYDAMDGYHAFSTTDMVNWTDHGQVFHSSDVDWSWEKGGFLWAPGSARKDGKYYLYYPIKDKSHQWRVGVAVGDSPVGPFKDTGKPIDGLAGIDPKVFIDDVSGDAFIYNNPGVVAKLKPNMVELAETPRKIDYGPDEVVNDPKLRFKEGAYMHKKGDVYYFSYSNGQNKEHQGFYATGSSPYGPFEWQGALAPKPLACQDHHSIVEFKGQWYYFYHVAYYNNRFPKYREAQGRVFCFEKLEYNEDGTIQMIEHNIAR